jgi:hypothetical protein
MHREEVWNGWQLCSKGEKGRKCNHEMHSGGSDVGGAIPTLDLHY